MSNGTPGSEGTLITIGSSSTAYLVILGQACAIPDPVTAANLFGANWASSVQNVQSFAITGPVFTSGACLIQPTGQTSIYLYTWGLLFGLSSSATMDLYGFNNGTVYQVPPTVVQATPEGFEIVQ